MTWREVLGTEEGQKEAKVPHYRFSWEQARIASPNIYSSWKVPNVHNSMFLQRKASSAPPNPSQEAKGVAFGG